MIYFNVLYEGDKDDVDIICMPNNIAEKISALSQKFLDWLPIADSDIYWQILDGHKCSICETDGFVKWLNENYCKNSQKVSIIKQHVKFVNKYNTIEF